MWCLARGLGVSLHFDCTHQRLMICENGECLAFDIVKEVLYAHMDPQKLTVEGRISERQAFQLLAEEAYVMAGVPCRKYGDLQQLID